MSSTARICVTGATGFLGRALVRRLSTSGAQVLAWGRSPHKLAALQRETLVVPFALDFRELDEADGRRLAADALVEFRPDVLIHAGWDGVAGTDRDRVEQSDNVQRTLTVLRLAGAAGAGRFMGIGSQAEYGPLNRRLSEDEATHPETMYGIAKRAAGELALACASRLGMTAVWVRLFSIYGPDQPWGLLPELIGALRSGRSLQLSACTQTWDFLFSDDAADALALLAGSKASGVFNLASGKPVVLADVVREVYRQLAPGSKPRFGERSSAASAPQHLEGDPAKLKHVTGWTPTTDIAEGIRRMIRAASESNSLTSRGAVCE